jgi:lysozyme family protein
MSQSIDDMIGIILDHEVSALADVVHDDPTDAGGPTKDGISLRYLKGVGIANGDLDHDGDIDINDVALVTPDIAAEFFKRDFYKQPHYDTLPGDIQPMMFDIAVNMGAEQATKCLQRAILAEDDGRIGDQTRSALDGAVSRVGLKVVINSTCHQFDVHYDAVVAAKPSQVRFIQGWKNRVNSWRTK